jgi:glucose/arabinose dehydrogenase
MRFFLVILTLVFASIASASAQDAGTQIFGKNPLLPKPEKSLVPVVNIAPAKGWPEGVMPKAAPALKVNAFATGLDHPRWIYILPNNDVLVAETNRPPKENVSLKEWIMGKFMSAAGAGGESANRISLLRDADGDGVAEMKTAFLENLYSPFGMALVGNNFYVANANGIVRYPYKEGETKITAKPEFVADLPGGPRNHHWTKNIVASKDGTKLYAAVGSNSNAAENGMEEETMRAAILEIDLNTGKKRVFASGLRNPVGMDWNPETGALWTAVNERDELGNNLVPDYMTSVKDGGFYGWPYSYFGQHVDERVNPQNPDLVAKAIVPDYALGAHTASLGFAFYTGDLLGGRYRNGAFIGQHGSWNREPPSGYKLVFIPFLNGQPNGNPEDILTGFLNKKGEAYGRPVGVGVDKKGAVLLADDVGNVIWRVTPKN